MIDNPQPASPEEYPILTLADDRVLINTDTSSVHVDDIAVRFTSTEFRVLTHLAQQRDSLTSYADLSQAVWGQSDYYQMSNSMLVTVSNVRIKLGPELRHIRNGAIRTKRGLGYVAVSTLEFMEEPS